MVLFENIVLNGMILVYCFLFFLFFKLWLNCLSLVVVVVVVVVVVTCEINGRTRNGKIQISHTSWSVLWYKRNALEQFNLPDSVD